MCTSIVKAGKNEEAEIPKVFPEPRFVLGRFLQHTLEKHIQPFLECFLSLQKLSIPLSDHLERLLIVQKGISSLTAELSILDFESADPLISPMALFSSSFSPFLTGFDISFLWDTVQSRHDNYIEDERHTLQEYFVQELEGFTAYKVRKTVEQSISILRDLESTEAFNSINRPRKGQINRASSKKWRAFRAMIQLPPSMQSSANPPFLLVGICVTSTKWQFWDVLASPLKQTCSNYFPPCLPFNNTHQPS